MEHSALIKSYRWLVFGLAAFFCVYSVVSSEWDGFGGPFRYLTVWALFMSTFVAARVLMISYDISDNRFDGFSSATAVVNLMVVFLFWRLYFADSASVTKDGTLQVWWREYYMHGVGAVLMWIDAFLINRVFTRIISGLCWLMSTVVGYLLWAEWVIGPLNDTPTGTVTSGLPYPFLNNLDLSGRMEFYITNVVVAVVVFAVFCALAWGLRRVGIRHG